MTARPPASQASQAERIVRRVPLGPVGTHARLVLEIDTTADADITRKFVRHIDSVRELLIAGHVTPDDAHALLLDCRWVHAGEVAR